MVDSERRNPWDGPFPIGFVGCVEDDIRVAVAHEYQGNGLAVQMIELISKKYPTGKVKIKVDNTASRRAFEKAGYEVFATIDDLWQLRLKNA